MICNIKKLFYLFLYFFSLFLPAIGIEKYEHSLTNQTFNSYQQNETDNLAKHVSENKNLRLLQSEQQLMPIRITHNYTSFMSDETQPLEFKFKFQQLVNVVELYFSKFLKIQPNQGNNIFRKLNQSYHNDCLDMSVPNYDKTNGIPNSDLHIYYNVRNNTSIQDLIVSQACSYSQNNLRPNFGILVLNNDILKLNSDFDFQEMTKLLIHQFIHILGFSKQQFKFWRNENKEIYGHEVVIYQMRGDQIQPVLITPNVAKTARKYYSCSRIIGMQLENQLEGFNSQSHWETALLFEENQLVQDKSNSALSIFTVALLKDTGFWDEVNENMASQISWGKNKGCEFFFNLCFSEIKFIEFFDNYSSGCDFNGNSKGIKSISKFSDGCNLNLPKKNGNCQDNANSKENLNISIDQHESFSYNSKCFISNLYRDKQKQQKQFNEVCYRYQCSDSFDAIKIIISSQNIEITCTLEDQDQFLFISNQLMEGSIQCPTDYNIFCQNRQCKNFCSSNGICINSICHCLKGYMGEDCSIQVSNGFIYESQIVPVCPQNYFVNPPDHTCRKQCPKSYYANQQTQMCEECDFSCSKCTGPSKNECIKCQYLTYLFNGQCLSQCPMGYFADELTNKCEECKLGCSKCKSFYQCSECSQGYDLIGQLYNIEGQIDLIPYQKYIDLKIECVLSFDNYQLDLFYPQMSQIS